MRITADAYDAIVSHARATAPHECCGLLLGTRDTIVRTVQATNRAVETERRYEIDPQDHFAAIRLAREGGLDVVGAYHSHPRTEPVPSATDRAAAFENFIFVIAGRRAEQSGDEDFAIRAWQLYSGNFVELPLVSGA